jgi:hypothetical protein
LSVKGTPSRLRAIDIRGSIGRRESRGIASNPEGGYRVTPTSTITARLVEGISLTEVSYEIWGPRGDAANFHEPTQGDVDP